jgi:hypothetical protein
MLDVFVEMMGEVGVTPNYFSDGEGNITGVYLTLSCRGKERKSVPLPTVIPLKKAPHPKYRDDTPRWWQ